MHVYFSGIGGVGIGPLALLALDAGYTVSGSDAQESEMTKTLIQRGVKVYIGTDESNVKAVDHHEPIDWLVHTAALTNNHPELRYAKARGITISKRDAFLNQLLKELGLKMVAVSGTHGKTTTTAMIVWLFKKLGLPVSYSIGTTVPFGPAAQYQKGSEYFVYEADEFDRNMLAFHPEISVIPSLEYDHPDTYPTVADYIEAFRQFTIQSKLTIAWEGVAEKLGDDGHLFVVPEDRDFSLIKLPGAHNRKNAWLAATAINRLKLSEDTLDAWHDLLRKISTFPGTSRRFEKLADNLYTDYAHHPSEIAATIQLARELNQSIVVVYQPHQNIRQHELLHEQAYRDCFAGIKKLYWLPTYLSREDKALKILAPEEILKSVMNIDGEVARMNGALAKTIEQHQKAGDLVICMSAGDLDPRLRRNI